MSNVIPLHGVHAETITESTYEHLTDAQLIYQATSSCDLAQDILFDREMRDDAGALDEARFEVLISFLALKVLAKRMLGRPYGEVKADVDQAFLERLAREPGESAE